MKSIYRTIIAAAGSFLAAQFGGWDAALETLVCFMAIDWITGGVLLPVVFKKSPKSENGTLESRAGWKGLSLIVKVVVSKNIYFLFVHVIRYCSVPDHHHFE